MLPARIAAIILVSSGLTACAQGGPASAALVTAGSAVITQPAQTGQTQPNAAMLRYPDVSATHIVFGYADDLWIVPKEGGQAVPLASPPGQETFPRFSPDGNTIGFVGNYEGNRDLYTIPVQGGVPIRVTHHPATETLCDWTPDGELLYYSNAFTGLRRQMQLLTVPGGGGLPSKLPPPYGANGAISPDGKWLAYTPHTRDSRTWKRYRGGMATDIWLLNLDDHTSKKITDWEGTDSLPMWHGDALYYLSDAGNGHRLNIWAYDTKTERRTQVTRLNEYDVKWPSIGPGSTGGGEIVFQNGPDLYLLDLATRQARNIPVAIPGDRPTIRPRDVDASEVLRGWDVSSTGKRAVLGARGDLWTVPAEKGSPRNLTRSSSAAERSPAWSPDGRWIAYFCDKTGEYELYITQSDGKGETKQLTTDGRVFRSSPTWSPDSKYITFNDKTGALYLHTIETGETKLIDREPWAGRLRVSWSHDSLWIAYTKGGDNRLLSIWLYNRDTGEKHHVTGGRFQDTWPTFDRKGDYLFFASNRDFTSPIYEDIGSTFVYANTDVLVAVPLRDEVGSPWAPKSDEETWDDEEKEEDDDGDDDEGEDDDDDGDDDEDEGDDDDDEAEDDEGDEDEDNGDDEEEDDDKEKEKKPVVIEVDGFERRALQVPVKRGAFYNLAVSNKGKLIYTRGAMRGTDDKPSIKIFDLEDEEKEEKTVLDDTRAFRITADGKKLLVRQGKKMAIVDAKADQKLDKPMSLSGMTARIDPRAEWRQVFTDAWRIQRDFFYDPNMHGVDWPAVREHYGAMLDDCVSRRDVSFVIGEMIAELNVGHAYVMGSGGTEDEPEVAVGMLGADYELNDGAYRIIRIYEGAPWDLDGRGPLSKPGVDVKEGDYLLAVNGVPLDTSKDPWAALQGLAGKVVTLTVNEKPTVDDDARDVVVETLRTEGALRYRAWIERNRKHVEEKTNGKVGYIYVPNTSISGQNDLIRQFYGQTDKGALIIDERWNSGGQIPTRFIEMLNRPVTNYWARRDGRDSTTPPDGHAGPKCMLINGLAGSGGDCFPYYFRQAKLGKLIGMRTWGGLVGLSGNPGLIDGAYVSVPTFAFYETNGTWGVEGHGVDPDIEVVDDPALMVDGGDPQLDAAIEHMLAELKRNPYVAPKRPAYPDRSGMGIRQEDQ